ncbi:hypothetical protein D3C84_1116310 [compost metagenome]
MPPESLIKNPADEAGFFYEWPIRVESACGNGFERFEIQQGEITTVRPPASRIDVNHIAKADGHIKRRMPHDQCAQAFDAMGLLLIEPPS